MSEINHEPEFAEKRDKPAPDKRKVELSEAYARVFLGTPDGRLVLKDLRRICDLRGPCFKPNAQGQFDTIAAAHRDGERSVILHIEGALYLARPKDPDVESEAI